MTTVLLCMEHAENRRILADWLSDEYDVAEADAAEDLENAFDLALVDREWLGSYGDALAARKDREKPVLLPYLWVVPERDLERFGPDVWKHVDAVVQSRVDEIITTPIRKAELRGRIEHLLQSRRYSLDLKEQKEQYRRLVEVAPEAIATLDGDEGSTIGYLNSRGADLLGVDEPEDVVGESLLDFVHDADREAVGDVVSTTVEDREAATFREGRVVAADGTVRHVEIAAAPVTFDRRPAAQVVVRDVTDRIEYERDLERQRDALRKLDRLNAVIRDIDQALVRASSTDEIDEAVCERLVGTNRYSFAWVGEPMMASDAVRPRASAGEGDGYLDAIDLSEMAGEAATGPTGRALATHELQFVRNVETDEGYGPWRDAARAHGFESSVAIPLLYGDSLYGVLNLYADHPDAFDQDERAVLAELGETIGYAINAVESKKALLTNHVVQVELDIADPDLVLPRLSERFDCAFSLEDVVANAEGEYLEYFKTTCEAPDELLECFEDAERVVHARHVGERDGEHVVELVFGDGLLVETLADLGATVESIRVERGRCALTVEMPYGGDTRAVVEALQNRLEAVSLNAQRETNRQVRTPHEVWDRLEQRLTDRQRSTLEAAHAGGYFNWPRDSTAEEVAESMNISSPTLHQHLRAAQKKLLDSFLDGGASGTEQ